uniref:Transmembrane protein 144 n=1 Tax=Angiostrongylus cantonensis TaxID=6313 RepID=A0A0K0D794_ANGCA
MAVGSLMWNTVTCIVGWAVARFGLFGCTQKIPHDNIMNIIGVVVVCIGGGFFATLKHHPVKVRPAPWQLSTVRCFSATLLTIFTGVLYGNMTTPMCHLVGKTGADEHPQTYTTFFFSFSLGALMMSSIIFMIYSLLVSLYKIYEFSTKYAHSFFRRNRPFINPEITAPSLLAGLMYGTATFLFFFTNQHLDPVKL